MTSLKLALSAATLLALSFLCPAIVRGQQTQAQQPSSSSTQAHPAPAKPFHHRPVKPPQWGHVPAQRPSYSFKPGNSATLRHTYSHRLEHVNRERRIRLVIGGFFPYEDIEYLSPLPPDLRRQVPPPPHGYSMGYCDGYVIVYDRATFYIANLIDLLQ